LACCRSVFRTATRTFEIPACGTLLATERTADTTRFFAEDEALFFDEYDHLAQRLAALLERPEEIHAIAGRGHQRLLADGRDYASVLSGVLERLSIQ
jgi:spore maturation protein CgeB